MNIQSPKGGAGACRRRVDSLAFAVVAVGDAGKERSAAPGLLPYLNVSLAITPDCIAQQGAGVRAVASLSSWIAALPGDHARFIVGNSEELHVAENLGRQVLQDESSSSLKVRNREFPAFPPVCPGNVRGHQRGLPR